MTTDKRRLGRGLDALLGGSSSLASAAEEGSAENGPSTVPVDQITANPWQPRRDFDPDELAALKQSLTTHGLLQPVLVRPTDGGYQLIAGERRLRAAREAGWKEIPVHIVNLNDQATFEAALVENLQRSDLNPIEKAQGFHDYLQRFQLTQEELAQRIGLDRSTIANLIRLLELPLPVQDAVRSGQISGGHARALLGLDDPAQQAAMCREIITRGLSVRQVEALVKEAKAQTSQAGVSRPECTTKTAHVQQVEDQLRQRLATRVVIKLRGVDKGQIVIHFENNEEFERLVGYLHHSYQRAA